MFVVFLYCIFVCVHISLENVLRNADLPPISMLDLFEYLILIICLKPRGPKVVFAVFATGSHVLTSQFDFVQFSVSLVIMYVSNYCVLKYPKTCAQLALTCVSGERSVFIQSLAICVSISLISLCSEITAALYIYKENSTE